MKKRLFSKLLLPLLTLSVTGCSCSIIDSIMDSGLIPSSYAEEQQGYRLSVYDKTYVIGETYTFYYYGFDKNGKQINYDNSTIILTDPFGSQATYSVDDASILSIDQYGNTVALKEGSTYVYLKCGNILNFRCKITVEKKKLQKLEVNNFRNKYYVGKSFNFACEAYAVYQNGFKELITPTIDDSEVNKDIPGKYKVKISYSINGTTKSINREIEMLDASAYVLTKTTMDYTLNDLNQNSGSPMLPTFGSPKMLIIPVKFTDSDNYIKNYSNVREDINTVFFGTSSEIGYESVKTYYEKESLNKVSLTGTVSEWYNSGKHSSDVYGDSANNTLRNKAIEWFFENNPDEDRKSYDLDNDGYLDGVVFVYGSLDRSTGNLPKAANDMWASVSSRTGIAPNVEKPIACGSMWVSYDFLYPTRSKAFLRTGKSDYAESDYAGKSMPYLNLDPFTFIHETGHMFGLSDYYSYSDEGIFYAGHANMQTASMLTHDPYSLMLFGWANPYIPEFEEQTITINALVDSHDFIMLRPEGTTGNSPFDEYILIDLYTPTGLNKFHAIDHPVRYEVDSGTDELAYPGIRIWHVDARLANRNKGYTVDTLTTDPTTPGASYINDNSRGKITNSAFTEFVELELIRNDTNKQLSKLSYNRKEDLFNGGDSFNLEKFKKQFANGTLLDNEKELGWTINVDGIYYSDGKYTADITVKKTNS